MTSPMRTDFQKKTEFQKKAGETYRNLQACWKVDLNWSIYPSIIREVSCMCIVPYFMLWGCIRICTMHELA